MTTAMRTWKLAVWMMVSSTPGFAQGCAAPAVPFLPADPADIRTYADILRADFEAYFVDANAYFRCLEQERNRAFVEAQDVTAAYAQMLEVLRE
ncbi:hypothetical protein N9571_01155 [Yoonia sp.]|nr:hypothetical protein [Yoonia sp.]